MSPLIVVLLVVSTLSAAQPAPAAGVIAGRVVEAGTNAPIADARITLFSVARQADAASQPSQTTSGRDGTFRFEGLAPGQYRLNGQKPGYVMVDPVLPLPPWVNVEAGGLPASPVVLLQRGGVIAGRVLTPDGEPIAQAPVFALQHLSGDPSERLRMAAPFVNTNDLGEFRIHGLAAGDYYIQAAPSLSMSNNQSTTVLAHTFYPGTVESSAARPVTIRAGATIGAIDIPLLEVPAYTVRGVVVDESGNAIANAGVQLTGDPSRGLSRVRLRTRAGADGSFALGGVQSGSYRLNTAWPNVSKSTATGGVAGFVSGPGGVSVVTESRNGITTELRFEPSSEVGVEIQHDDVSGVQLTVRRPQ